MDEEEVVGGGGGHVSAVKAVRVSRMGRGGGWQVLSGGKDHSVRLWEVKGEGEALHCVGVGRHHKGSVEAVEWLDGSGGDGGGMGGGGRFVSGGWDQQILLWDATQQRRLDEGEALEEAAPSKRLRADPSSSPSPSPLSLSPLSSISAHSGCVTGLSSPFPTAVYSASFDSSVRHFDLTESRQVAVWWVGGGKAVSGLDISADGRSAAIGCWDGAIRLLDLRTSASQLSIQSPLSTSHRNVVSALSFSPSRGPQLISASYDGTCKVWDIRARIPLTTLQPSTPPPTPSHKSRKDRKGDLPVREDREQLLTVQWSAGQGDSGGEHGHGEEQLLTAGSGRRLHTYTWQRST